MYPLMLAGHTRALTKLKYNREGDLLFTAAKDNAPCLFYAHNGERVGTYQGHNGAIWTLDVTADSQRLLTGSADNSAGLWDVATGKQLYSFTTDTAVRSVAWAQGDRQAVLATDARMGHPAKLLIYDMLQPNTDKPTLEILIKGSRPTVVTWTPGNQHLLTGHEDGTLTLWDTHSGTSAKSIKEHGAAISDLQWSRDMTHFITASKDTTAKIFDGTALKPLKKYQTERPVNGASISPLREEVILGGGQEAMQVTTTSTRIGKFEVRFFHKIFEDEMGRVKGHFGPINTVAYRPDGLGFASGGEDGYVRVHAFDPDYFDFKFEI